MKNLLKYKYLIPLLIILVGGLSVHRTSAAPGLTIIPGQVSIDVQPGGSASQVIKIDNNYDTDVQLNAELQGINQTAGKIIPSSDIDKSLQASTTFSSNNFKIEAHKNYSFTVTVTDNQNLEPGGHYGTILISQTNLQNQVSLNLKSAVSIGLYVVKRGGDVTSVSVESFKHNGWLLRLPSQVELTVKNIGNILVVPRSSSTVFSNSSTVISHGISNQDSQFALPGNAITFSAELKPISHAWLPGRYRLTTLYRADGVESSQSISKTMWYIPPYFLIALFAISLILVLLIKNIKKSRKSGKKWGFSLINKKKVANISKIHK